MEHFTLTELDVDARAPQRYRELIQLASIITKITSSGWLIDRPKLPLYLEKSKDRQATFTSGFLKESGLSSSQLGESGMGATDAVKDWFWKTMNAPPIMFNKITKKPQFNTETLITYATEYANEPYAKAAAYLYGMRKNAKSITYIKTYEILSAKNGRIHFGFNPAGTQTGRWSSSVSEFINGEVYKANAQQIPKKVAKFNFGDGPIPLMESLRPLFIPDEGCVLLGADYDQLELRLLAYTTGASKLIQWIEQGADTHMENAKLLFDLPPDARKDDGILMHKAAREAVKGLTYGFSYQVRSPNGRDEYKQQYAGLKKIFPQFTQRMVNELASRFFEVHPEILDFQISMRESIARHGYVQLPQSGHKLYYTNVARGWNQAVNFMFQGGGAFLINRAVLQLYPELQWNQGSQIRAQIHDELILHAKHEHADEVAALMERTMSLPAQFGNYTAGIPARAERKNHL